MLNKWLFTRVDNSALVVFRVFFGLLITLEAWGAIATGWIRNTLIKPELTFNFIGFDFLQPLPGDGMYYYYGIMGLFGVFVMLGYRYRLSVIAYGLMWASVYLMQKSSYNNHYYLLMLLLGLMATFPAHRYLSLDVNRNPALKRLSMPRWVYVVIIAQLWIVYTYAAVAKLYPDWLDATVPKLLMKARADYWLIGDLLQQEWVHYTIAYVGIFFDALIIPALLWKRTRKVAFVFSIFFHLFNSIIFQIGIFPYLSLAFTLFFFPVEKIHQLFIRKKTFYAVREIRLPDYRKPALLLFAIYFTFQIGLPVRHWFIKDDVLWTEEGHRLSWRMMLRSKAGVINFRVIDKESGNLIPFSPRELVTNKQYQSLSTKPDVIWQFCQRIEESFAEQGRDVAIYVNCRVRVNDHNYHTLIDPEEDMAAAEWDYWGHNEWILPSPLDKNDKITGAEGSSFD